MTIGSTLAQRWGEVASRGGQHGISFGEGHYSYHALWLRAGGVQKQLMQAHVVRGDYVVVLSETRPELLSMHVACAALGAVVVPVHPGYGPTELTPILADVHPKAVVVGSAAFAEVMKSLAPTLPQLDLLAEVEECEPRIQCEPHDSALVVFTSGTTGEAKGAELTHAQILANLNAIHSAWKFTHADRLLLDLPMFHVHGLVLGLWGAALAGADVVLLQKFVAGEVVESVAKHRCTVLFGVPTHYYRLLREPLMKEASRSLRLATCGSAPLAAELWEEFANTTGLPIVERYGMSEALFVSSNPLDAPKAGTVGFALPGVDIAIRDDAGQAVAPATVGSVWIKSSSVFRGYVQRPEATAKVMRDGWLVSGDLGRMRTDGYLELVGREKELIISGGYNIFPGEVERVLEGVAGIREVAVVGAASAEYGEVVRAVCVIEPGVGVTLAQVQELCRGKLASYKIPRELQLVSELPRNALGKLQRQKLRGAKL